MISAVWREIIEDGTPYLLLGLALVLLALRAAPREERRRLVWTFYPLGLHLLLVVPAGILRAVESSAYTGVRFATLVCGVFAGVGLASLLAFGIVLGRLGLQTPRILRDVIVGVGSVVGALIVASGMGFDVTGLVATSAILTAVLALSLQDTLGNVVAGLALQLDRTVAVGDWVKFGDVSGRVSELRWRHTAIETRNWETLIVPNSALVKGNVLVLGRRTGQKLQWRRWVYFHVDFRHPPVDVIEAVLRAIRGVPITNVAKEPPPNCILMDLDDSYGRYAVRYWLTDILNDDPTDSEIRTRIFFGLRRAGIPLSIPAHAVFLTEESEKRKRIKEHAGLDQRLAAIERVDLFAPLTPDERRALAEDLLPTPFAPGEVLTRQGAEAHWLYLVIAGQVSVRVASPSGDEQEVARLGEGSFFGEAGLLTDEPRTASVIALTEVECYRLGKDAFRTIIRDRPELAGEVAEILATRQVQLKAVTAKLEEKGRTRQIQTAKKDFLTKMRDALGLSDDS